MIAPEKIDRAARARMVAASTRILLADDHNLVVEALLKLLEPHFTIVGTVADGHALLTTALHLEVLSDDIHA